MITRLFSVDDRTELMLNAIVGIGCYAVITYKCDDGDTYIISYDFLCPDVFRRTLGNHAASDEWPLDWMDARHLIDTDHRLARVLNLLSQSSSCDRRG